MRLRSRQARANKNDICPVKEELYDQCFSEIIRQVTISEPERGLLLMRVKDDIKQTILAYHTLYQSAVTFSMRKQLQAEHGKPQLEAEISDLQTECKELGNSIVSLTLERDNLDQRMKEKRESIEKRQQEESKFFNKKKDDLEEFLKKLTG